METWAIVVIVLVSNAIIGAVSVLTARKQLKHSVELFEMQKEVQNEKERRERRREVRSEPLRKLRDELARMAAKGEKVASMVITMPFSTEGKEPVLKFKEALGDWNTYMTGGEFQQVLFMQYDLVLVDKVNAIKSEYENARYRLRKFWKWLGDPDKEKEYEESINVVERNRRKIAEVQSEINKLLEEL